MKNLSLLPFYIVLLISLTDCSNQKEQVEEKNHLGTIKLQVTGSSEAQVAFEEGLLLLHSFEFDDACLAFLKAQKQDSTFLMAYWGEAMTYNHPLWRQQDFTKGQAALDKFKTYNQDQVKDQFSELEQDFWKAMKTLYAEEGDKKTRDQAYSEHLKMMHQKYPKNHEVSAFYALSILGAVPVGRDVAAYEKAAKIAEGIIAENPRHPGALHYTIHSYDDPYHAKFALKAANSYSKIAPDAAHALHMPSHIYVAMGMWDEVVSSNVASYDASVKRMQRKDLDNDARSYHALHWLLYGLLQKGKYEQAQKIMADMLQYHEELPSKQARNYLIRMKGNLLMETDNWVGDFANVEVDIKDLNISMQAVFNYIKGRQAFVNEEPIKLTEIINAMEKDRVTASLYIGEGGATMCSNAPGDYNPNQLDIDQASILEMELRALAAQLKNNKEATENWLKKSVALQDSTSYAYGPPIIIEPTYELYGKWLAEEQRYEEALTQFEKALEKGPNRTSILKHQLKVYEVIKNEEKVKETKDKLKINLKEADELVKANILGQEQLSVKTM